MSDTNSVKKCRDRVNPTRFLRFLRFSGVDGSAALRASPGWPGAGLLPGALHDGPGFLGQDPHHAAGVSHDDVSGIYLHIPQNHRHIDPAGPVLSAGAGDRALAKIGTPTSSQPSTSRRGPRRYFNGVDSVSISKRLGHAQVSTTANIYAHVMEEADQPPKLV